jgi:hypothetical protein
MPFSSGEIMKYLLCLFLVILCGCASAISKVGKDTYMVSATSAGFGTGGVRAKVFEKANAFCEKKGLVMVPVNLELVRGKLASNPPSAELTFRAVLESDVENQRPERLKTSADHIQVLEIKQK